MKTMEKLRLLAEVTAVQWGMVTSAQAAGRGVSRLDLSRLSTGGHLVRLAHGVYMDVGVPETELDEVRAAWLSTDPKVLADERINAWERGVVVAGRAAASLHGLGDFRVDQFDFVSPDRRQSQREGIRFRRRMLEASDVTLVEGLPVMTVERVIVDLLADFEDRSLVADVVRDVFRQYTPDRALLPDLLAPLAARYGFPKMDGVALLHDLMEEAGVDRNSMVQRFVSDASLGGSIAAEMLSGLSTDELERLGQSKRMRESLSFLEEVIAGWTSSFVAGRARQLRQIDGDSTLTGSADGGHPRSYIEEALARDLAEHLASQLLSGEVLQGFAQGFAAVLLEQGSDQYEDVAEQQVVRLLERVRD